MALKTLGTEYSSKEERIMFLKDNCDKVEEAGYMKDFTTDELAEMKESLSNISIEINDVEEEKKIQMDMFKERLKPLIEEKSELLRNLKQKSEFVREICYVFIDDETKTVDTYNSEGVCISQRPALAKELQKSIFSIQRDGTNN